MMTLLYHYNNTNGLQHGVIASYIILDHVVKLFKINNTDLFHLILFLGYET